MAASIENLANILIQGQGREPSERDGGTNRRGRAVFLIGAGCSVTAGIAPGAEVARLCAKHLAELYRRHDQVAAPQGMPPAEAPAFTAEEAISWLIRERGVPEWKAGSKPDWGRYYTYFFDEHLVSINQQREFIEGVIETGGNRLNWEHACLGELVACRYVHTVLTTNFDQLVLQGVIRTGELPVIADGIEALNRVTPEPRRPQIVHLHGSMHTYNPRNSQAAVSETDRDPTLRSMLYTVLHRCDVLVVVGYAGNEEGVMRLLIEAARQLPPLVVYWVIRDPDGALSSRAEEFMSIGENKYTLRGFSAAQLFQNLMTRLKIGEPRWIADPMRTLRQQSIEFALPDGVDPEVAQSIGRFKAWVDAVEEAPPRQPSRYDEAAGLRLRGRYAEALTLLGTWGDDVDASDGLLELRAANAFSLAAETEGERIHLGEAIRDFNELARRLNGPKRVECAVQLFKALMLLYDRSGEDEIDRVRDIVGTFADPQRLAMDAPDGSTRADVHLMLGAAYQIIAEKSAENGPEQVAAVEQALVNFRAASDELNERRDWRWAEAQAGLATTLQVQAKNEREADLARQSVWILQALVSSVSAPQRESADRLKNLAEALSVQANLMEPLGRRELREAEGCLNQALRLYRALGSDAEESASRSRDLLQSIERMLEP